MDNLEKMRAVGEMLYGNNWQSPLARALKIDGRTMRRFVSAESKIPVDLSTRLLSVIADERQKIASAEKIISSDKMRGDDVDIEMVEDIANRYEYCDEQARKGAMDAINNAIYEETYLSDLDAIARRFAL